MSTDFVLRKDIILSGIPTDMITETIRMRRTNNQVKFYTSIYQRKPLSVIYPTWLVWMMVVSIALVGMGVAFIVVALITNAVSLVAVAAILLACGFGVFLFVSRTGRKLRFAADRSMSYADVFRNH